MSDFAKVQDEVGKTLTPIERDLPDNLSDVIDYALDDLEKCHNDPRYKIDMSNWHVPEQHQCNVCLAGAVIAKTFGADPKHTFGPAGFSERNANRLQACDHMRKGYVMAALQCVDVFYSDPRIAQFKSNLHELTDRDMLNLDGLDVANPAESFDVFVADLRLVATALRAADL